MEVEQLQTLLKQPGWVRLVELVHAQVKNREDERRRSVMHSIHDGLHMNLGVGIILGMEGVIGLPTTLIEEKSRDYRQKLEEYNATSLTATSAE